MPSRWNSNPVNGYGNTNPYHPDAVDARIAQARAHYAAKGAPRLPVRNQTARDIIKTLEENGFKQIRQDGSHLTLHNPATGLTTQVPVHGNKPIGVGLVQDIWKQAGLW